VTKKIGAALFLSALFLAALLPVQSMAAVANWSTTCKLRQCAISTSAMAKGSRDPVLTVAILVASDRSDPQLLVTTPLGSAIEPGARAKIGNITLSLKFKACYPDGCRAHAILDAALLDTLIAASAIEFRYFAQSSERQVSASIPMQGLAEALASLPQN
jgi:invasion protein IalB